MNIVYPNLQKAMIDKGVTVRELSKLVGECEEIVYLKLQGVREWNLLEAVTICRYFQHSDLKALFLR